MPLFVVLKIDIFHSLTDRSGMIDEAQWIVSFRLDTTKTSFHHGIISSVATPTHTLRDIMKRQTIPSGIVIVCHFLHSLNHINDGLSWMVIRAERKPRAVVLTTEGKRWLNLHFSADLRHSANRPPFLARTDIAFWQHKLPWKPNLIKKTLSGSFIQRSATLRQIFYFRKINNKWLSYNISDCLR